ncbi:hypothetical protein [Devosia sp. Root635]|uniref:hypothetical protein n=1 Tax=Devosia sp. Root635 TaxID=1736575 RepID=UPI0006F2FFB2|nr:hypothetical protein [Devosia sp. Root635]KRA40233.1 hypothetical protein ASD80_12545 [Devosia sp. Root635]
MEQLCSWLESQSGGVRTYIEFQKKSAYLAQKDQANGSLYILLGMVAQRFSNRYDGEPLPVDTATAALQEFAVLLRRASDLANKDANLQLRFLNEIATLDLTAQQLS